jgi:uncharacterized membrane protein YdfJ with MMPL/SSD domain
MGMQSRAARWAAQWFVPLVVIMSVALVALALLLGQMGLGVPDDIGSWRWSTARLG